MIIEAAGGLVSGGINAVGNIIDTIGKGAGTFFSGFFPAQQRETVKSQIVAPAGGQGLTHRPVADEMQSLLDLARPQGVEEYQVSKITQPDTGKIDNMLADIFGGLKIATETKSLVDEFLDVWGIKKRDTETGKPRAGYPAGQNVTYWDKLQTSAADVLTVAKTAGTQLLNQVKGLFNLGYEGPEGSQPVFTITHELEGKTKLTAFGIVALIIIGLLLFRGRK